LKKELHDKDDRYTKDMIFFAKSAISYCSGMGFDEFCKDSRTVHAVTYCIQTIGEASIKISAERRSSLPAMPWNEMKGMRNVLVHMYKEGDPAILWKTVNGHLPNLVKMLENFLDGKK